MKRKIISLLALAVLTALANGCAFSKSTVKIDFKPQSTASKVTVDQSIAMEPLQDQRGVNPYVLSNKGIGTKTSGTYETEKPVAVVVTDAIKDALAALNYKIASGQGDLVLSGELLRLDSNPIMGFWSGQLECTIQVNLKLTEKKTGKQIWSALFTGYYKKSGLQVDGEGHRKDTTEGALADLTNKLANSTDFRSAIQNYRPD